MVQRIIYESINPWNTSPVYATRIVTSLCLQESLLRNVVSIYQGISSFVNYTGVHSIGEYRRIFGLCFWDLINAFSLVYHLPHYNRLFQEQLFNSQIRYISILREPLSISRGGKSIVFVAYSISQEICTRFLLCCALLWLYIDWFSNIHQAYFTGTVAI